MALQRLSTFTYSQIKNIGNKFWSLLSSDEKLSVFNIAQQKICNLRDGYSFDTADTPQSLISTVISSMQYAAMLDQSGTDDPTASVSANNLGVTITWTRSSTGTYVGTLSAAVVVANIYPSASINRLSPVGDETHTLISMIDTTHIQLLVMDSSFTLTDGFNDLRIEITQYS